MADDQTPRPETNGNSDNQKGLGIKNIISSVLAAGFGIQSQKNRERDFENGSPGDYIVVGIIFVVVLVVGMIMFVNSVVSG